MLKKETRFAWILRLDQYFFFASFSNILYLLAANQRNERPKVYKPMILNALGMDDVSLVLMSLFINISYCNLL